MVCSVFFFTDSLSECGYCRSPYWWHMYETPGKNQATLFHVKQWNRKDSRWRWIPVGTIVTQSQADEMRLENDE